MSPRSASASACADHLGVRFERLGVEARACPRVVGSGKARLGACDALDRRDRPPGRGLADVARLGRDLDRAVDLARGGRERGHVDEQEAAPCRIDRELGAPCKGLLAERRVAELRGDELEREPCGAEIARDGAGLGRLACRSARALEILLDVLGEDRALGERARALLRRDGRGDERLDQLAEVRERTTSLEQTHEALERLAEARVGVVRREVVARGAGLVAAALLDLAGLVEEARLACAVARCVDLGTEPADGGGDRLDRLDGGRRELRCAGDRARRRHGLLGLGLGLRHHLVGDGEGRVAQLVDGKIVRRGDARLRRRRGSSRRRLERVDDIGVVEVLGVGRRRQRFRRRGGRRGGCVGRRMDDASIALFTEVDRHVHGRRCASVHPLSFVRLFGHPRRRRRYRSNAAVVPS